MQHEILDMKLNISEYLFRMMHLIDVPVELLNLKNKYTKVWYYEMLSTKIHREKWGRMTMIFIVGYCGICMFKKKCGI